MCATAACLAQLPLQDEAPYSISAVMGVPTTDPWNTLPVTVKDVAKATREDRVYGKLLFYGSRIIVPTALQTRLLEELHQTHKGAA